MAEGEQLLPLSSQVTILGRLIGRSLLAQRLGSPSFNVRHCHRGPVSSDRVSRRVINHEPEPLLAGVVGNSLWFRLAQCQFNVLVLSVLNAPAALHAIFTAGRPTSPRTKTTANSIAL